MLAISHQRVDLSIGDAEVRALLVGTGVVLCVHSLGCSSAAFYLTPRRTEAEAGLTLEEGVEARRQAGQSSGQRGLSRRWTRLCLDATAEWEDGRWSQPRCQSSTREKRRQATSRIKKIERAIRILAA
jgi:hypothetical protein